jgi:hypothetical protein
VNLFPFRCATRSKVDFRHSGVAADQPIDGRRGRRLPHIITQYKISEDRSLMHHLKILFSFRRVAMVTPKLQPSTAFRCVHSYSMVDHHSYIHIHCRTSSVFMLRDVVVRAPASYVHRVVPHNMEIFTPDVRVLQTNDGMPVRHKPGANSESTVPRLTRKIWFILCACIACGCILFQQLEHLIAVCSEMNPNIFGTRFYFEASKTQ